MNSTPLDTFLSLWLCVDTPADLSEMLACITAEKASKKKEGLHDEEMRRVWDACCSKGRDWDLLHSLYTLQQTATDVPLQLVDVMVVLLSWEAILMRSVRWFFAECSQYIEQLIVRGLRADSFSRVSHENALKNVALALYSWNDEMLWRLDVIMSENSFQDGDNGVSYLKSIGNSLAGGDQPWGHDQYQKKDNDTTTTTTDNNNNIAAMESSVSTSTIILVPPLLMSLPSSSGQEESTADTEKCSRMHSTVSQSLGTGDTSSGTVLSVKSANNKLSVDEHDKKKKRRNNKKNFSCTGC
ncbi:hypothetical protein LSM04_003030 [Trypanosoma melophagium]|uniref:uncharacterized protein n=1 Tax=Trypanosoma melophagium TaxID=715481 RepID=UPI003519DF5B|nr:hypothetical protein LSM04_003030 [Trypanosoma melophagium]